MNRLTRRLLIAVTASLVFASQAIAQDKSIVVASTTSTQDSGLFGHILPMFKARTGIDVKVVAQGTGQALDTARRGDADVVFVHARPAEEKFLSEGFGVKRYPVMYNDFILVGPKGDPAGIKGSKDIVAALGAIKAKGADFISRGDKSGTHQARSASGRPRASTSARTRRHGTRRSGRAWGLRSTPHRHRMPMCSPIAAPGCRSRTAAISSSPSKATSGCSISMASCW
jgi:ABC-type tungstate transport system permease subunit